MTTQKIVWYQINTWRPPLWTIFWWNFKPFDTFLSQSFQVSAPSAFVGTRISSAVVTPDTLPHHKIVETDINQQLTRLSNDDLAQHRGVYFIILFTIGQILPAHWILKFKYVPIWQMWSGIIPRPGVAAQSLIVIHTSQSHWEYFDYIHQHTICAEKENKLWLKSNKCRFYVWKYHQSRQIV